MAYEERNNSINPISIEKDLIVRFSEGKYPTGKDFKALIEYINGVTIDLSQINESIYLGDRLVQKYNLINFVRDVETIFLYDKDRSYCMSVDIYSEKGVEREKYNVRDGNYYSLEESDGVFSETPLSDQTSSIFFVGNTDNEFKTIGIKRICEVDLRIFLFFTLIN